MRTGTARQSRRAALRALAFAGLGAAASPLLAACGAPPQAAPPPKPAAASATSAAPAATQGSAATSQAAPAATSAGSVTTPVAAPKAGGRIVTRVYDVQTPDPHRETGSFYWPQATCEAPTGVAADGSVKPQLAERWEVLDPRTYVFHLRRGVQFHNGREMVADDFKANFERIARLDRAWLKSTAERIESAEVVDRHTLKVGLKEPYAPFLALMAEAWIVAPETPGWDGNIAAPIGTGPFVWQSFVPKTELKIARHASYWRAPAPYVDEIVARFSDLDPVIALRAGDVQIAHLTRDQADALASDPNVNVLTSRASSWNFLSFNNRSPRPPLNDVRVRRAITSTLDKAKLAEVAGGATAITTNQMALPGTFYHDPNLPDEHAAPSLDAARRLLSEAGVDPKKTTLVMPVNSDPRVPQVVAAMIGELGFEVDLQVSDDAATEARLQKYDWDVYYAGSGPRTDIALRFVRLLSDGPNPGLWGGVQDSEYDTLVRNAFGTVDDDARRALYVQAWKLVMERYYTVVVSHVLTPFGVRKEVQGFELGSVPGMHLVDTGLSFARLG